MKKALFAIGVIVFLVLTYNLIGNTYSLWQKQNVVVEARDELERVKRENNELKNKLEVVMEPGFAEREARDKLLFSKPGEKIVLLPNEPEKVVAVTEGDLPAWRQWIALFF
jgi:cell division protein FtsB